ncbi:F-box family protein [Tasmannia lanceolata]|uniref:F-box family protein n=1 Tax=Tasmannia lanceolata TaxID=3420 RepID=UPI004064C2AE
MADDLSFGEVLKAVFPLLDGKDLASCMGVCRQWRDVARDDYFWKCLCSQRWPSVCKRPFPLMCSYHKLFVTFSKRHRRRTLLPPRLSFDNLEFYIDLWAEERLLFSEVVPGNVLQSGIKTPPSGICDVLRVHLEGPDYKMTMPVEPRFSIPLSQTISVSVFVGRKDTNKMACIVNRSVFDYVDATAFRALAFDYLDFSPNYPFVSGIRAWMSLLFMEDGNDGVIDVFGIEIDFCDAASSEDEVLWLLDMLDWK